MDTTDAVADSTEEPAAKKARTDDTEQAAAPAAAPAPAEAPADAAPSAEAPAPAAADAEEEEDDAAAKVRVIAGRRFANRDVLSPSANNEFRRVYRFEDPSRSYHCFVSFG